ncbi:response regulator [Chelatococcus sp. GCM10030263]|uniref:response regulator n=1 Tax=Chelatococcus sp. GCM10030263 TaxID=3273387 RepID=UPI0036198D05
MARVAQDADKAGISPSEITFLVEKNADGILVVDDAGVVLFANPAAEHVFGRSSEQLVGTAVGIPAVDGETADIVVLRPGGEKIEAEIRVVQTRWENRPAWLASLRDVSARRLVEERMRHAAKMEAIGRLTAGIAHDFNNLLTVIMGNLETVRRHRGNGNERLLSAADNAMTGAQRAAALTERLLAFARRRPLAPKPVDANRLVSGMSDLLSRTLGERIEVQAVLGKDLRLTHADPTELEAALLNLAVNARDAMPDGGKLIIETANVDLDHTYAATQEDAQTGPHVLISVTDTGTGMSREVLSRAVEPFFTTKDTGQGTGLGLSQVYGFVNQTGGHVSIYSEPGLGTTVKLYLPSYQGAEEPAVQAPIAAETPVSKGAELILVVEDDEDVRRYATASLRELGYRVLEADTGAAALEIIKCEPDLKLLFTDLGLPGDLDGRALAERARQKRPMLKVLLTTAYAGGALIHDGRLDADIELLPKPFSYVDLSRRVRQLLDASAPAPSILVVDDEALIRMLCADALLEAGFQVKEAGTRQEALQAIEAAGQDLAAVVLDVGLPDGRGDELVEQIRALRPELPVVLATGHGESSLRRSIAGDPYLRVLGKPFQPQMLGTMLVEMGVKPS